MAPVAAADGSLPPADFEVLALDPRHTGANHLSEVALLQHAGALQWQAIARRAGMRLRDLRAEQDRPVYASFYYAGIFCPRHLPLSSHKIDDRLGFSTAIRLFGDTMVDGWHHVRAEDGRHLGAGKESACRGAKGDAPADVTSIRMSNVFVAKRAGAARLEVCSPVNLDPRLFPRSSQRFDTYSKIKEVRRAEEFPAFGAENGTLIGQGVSRIPINPDRDINGVGLVYFANYITFLDTAERHLLREIGNSRPWLDVASRSLVRREIAYYANANADDEVEVRLRIRELVSRPEDPPQSAFLRFAYSAHRLSDGRLLCVSQADKLLLQRDA